MPSLCRVSCLRATCNRYAEKMRRPVTRKCAGGFIRHVKHEGTGCTRSFTFPAAEPQDIEKGWPVTTAPWRVVFSSVEQKVLDRADVVGRGSRRRQTARAAALRLSAGSGRAGADHRHHLQPVRHHHRPPAGQLPDRLRRQRQGHHLDRAGGAIRQHRLVAAFALPEQRSRPVERQERPLGDQLLPRPRADHRHWLDRRQPPLHAVRSRTTRRSSRSSMRSSRLIDQYPYLEYNPEKGDALLTAKGWTKDGDGMWQDETGAPVTLEIISFFDFTGVGPVVVEQLKRAGIEATYAEPPDMFDRFSAGDYTGCALRPRRQLQLRRLLLAAPLPDRFGEDSRWPPRQLLALAQRGVRQARRRAVRHQPDRDGQGDGDLEEVPGHLAAGVPGHPDLAGPPPPADEHHLLDGLADCGEPVRQHRPTST